MKKIWKVLSIIGVFAVLGSCYPIGKLMLPPYTEIVFSDHILWAMMGLLIWIFVGLVAVLIIGITSFILD